MGFISGGFISPEMKAHNTTIEKKIKSLCLLLCPIKKYLSQNILPKINGYLAIMSITGSINHITFLIFLYSNIRDILYHALSRLVKTSLDAINNIEWLSVHCVFHDKYNVIIFLKIY